MASERVLIVGAPGVGKTTLAESHRERLGLKMFLCTDTRAQARKARCVHERALYAPSCFDGADMWSELSRWVADTWLCNRGPWVIEGVAAVRALRKWHADNPGQPPPCETLLWPTEPRIDLSPRARAMGITHDEKMHDLTREWPELALMVKMV